MGPLAGLRVVELQGIGPGPFCGMMLADMGAELIRVDRSSAKGKDANKYDVLARGRKSIAVDLKSDAGVETVLKLVESADVLLEGFRPGVTERLGLGPDVCLARNPGLIYGRMTGWGQFGALASAAGSGCLKEPKSSQAPGPVTGRSCVATRRRRRATATTGRDVAAGVRAADYYSYALAVAPAR